MKKLLICMEGESMTPHWEYVVLFNQPATPRQDQGLCVAGWWEGDQLKFYFVTKVMHCT